ncbi:MAG: bifunctional hydroxymethylpyrimidine kinase/phosphomethylpyrimidine kinase [Limisphaerales bacterium]
MSSVKKRPVALSIAGSDSGGGAGVQADLKTFAHFQVHGTCAITCLTAQNPQQVTAIQPTRRDVLRAQIGAVFDRLKPAAVKTGMLYSETLIQCVADSPASAGQLVVDPVMVATSGAQLLKPRAIRVLKQELLPLAKLVTPNLDETELLLGAAIQSIEDAKAAAREIHARWGCAALVKGGHRDSSESTDVLFDGKRISLHRARRIPGAETHGTGCSLSAAIAANLALGKNLTAAVRAAKKFITAAIEQRYRAGRHAHLEHFPR